MHQYKLEAVIPLIIIVFVGAAFLAHPFNKDATSN